MSTARLEEILRKEISAAQELIDLLERQQYAIVHLNMDQLDALMEQEHQLVLSFQNLEKDRLKVLEELVPPARLKRPRHALTLRDVAALFDGPEAERLQQLGDTLRRETEAILTANRRIKILLNHSLRFVRESVDLITEGRTKQLVDQKI
jgi:flagellar biosynthesis/type III secretory pathway chaperone